MTVHASSPPHTPTLTGPLTPHAIGQYLTSHVAPVVPSGADKELHDKTTLLTVFQKCEEAVLAAMDDCGGDEDEAGCRRTLQLAKEVVEGMLGHRRLEEVGERGSGLGSVTWG